MAIREIIEPSREVLEDVIKLLGLAEHTEKEQIQNHLRAHANAFSMHRIVEGTYPTIHEDVARMRKVAEDCAALSQKIGDLHPLIYFSLNMSYSEKTAQKTNIRDLEGDLGILKSIAENFGNAKF